MSGEHLRLLWMGSRASHFLSGEETEHLRYQTPLTLERDHVFHFMSKEFCKHRDLFTLELQTHVHNFKRMYCFLHNSVIHVDEGEIEWTTRRSF